MTIFHRPDSPDSPDSFHGTIYVPSGHVDDSPPIPSDGPPCRDADIEIQTDGYDETSYGVIDSVHDPSMGWGAGGLFMRLFT